MYMYLITLTMSRILIIAIISSGSKIKNTIACCPTSSFTALEALKENLGFSLNSKIQFELQSKWPKFIGTLGIITNTF